MTPSPTTRQVRRSSDLYKAREAFQHLMTLQGKSHTHSAKCPPYCCAMEDLTSTEPPGLTAGEANMLLQCLHVYFSLCFLKHLWIWKPPLLWRPSSSETLCQKNGFLKMYILPQTQQTTKWCLCKQHAKSTNNSRGPPAALASLVWTAESGASHNMNH